VLERSKECVCGAVIPNDWHYCWECNNKRGLITLDEVLNGTERTHRHARAKIRAGLHQPTKSRMEFLRLTSKVVKARKDQPKGSSRVLSTEEREIDALAAQERILVANRQLRQTLAARVPQALKDWNDQKD